MDRITKLDIVIRVLSELRKGAPFGNRNAAKDYAKVSSLIEETKSELEKIGITDEYIYTDWEGRQKFLPTSKLKSPAQLREEFGNPILASKIFGKENVPAPRAVINAMRNNPVAWKTKMESSELQEIPIKNLEIGREFVFEKPLLSGGAGKAEVVKYEGKNYVINGNHTIAHAYINGNKDIKAHIVDLDSELRKGAPIGNQNARKNRPNYSVKAGNDVFYRVQSNKYEITPESKSFAMGLANNLESAYRYENSESEDRFRERNQDNEGYDINVGEKHPEYNEMSEKDKHDFWNENYPEYQSSTIENGISSFKNPDDLYEYFGREGDGMVGHTNWGDMSDAYILVFEGKDKGLGLDGEDIAQFQRVIEKRPLAHINDVIDEYYTREELGKLDRVIESLRKGAPIGNDNASKDHITQIDKVLTAKYPNIDFFIGQNDSTKMLTLSSIIIPKKERNKGLGTKFMEDLAQHADKMGYTIKLTPSSDFGGSKTRLIEFYKRFDFVENKGRNKNYRFMERMYRLPQ